VNSLSRCGVRVARRQKSMNVLYSLIIRHLIMTHLYRMFSVLKEIEPLSVPFNCLFLKYFCSMYRKQSAVGLWRSFCETVNSTPWNKPWLNFFIIQIRKHSNIQECIRLLCVCTCVWILEHLCINNVKSWTKWKKEIVVWVWCREGTVVTTRFWIQTYNSNPCSLLITLTLK
jgi:hypothetical protein